NIKRQRVIVDLFLFQQRPTDGGAGLDVLVQLETKAGSDAQEIAAADVVRAKIHEIQPLETETGDVRGTVLRVVEPIQLQEREEHVGIGDVVIPVKAHVEELGSLTVDGKVITHRAHQVGAAPAGRQTEILGRRQVRHQAEGAGILKHFGRA